MSKADKENVLLKNWYDDTVVEDREDCNNIAGMASRECLKRWNIGIGTNDEPEMVLGFYSVVFNTIIDALREKRNDAPEFAINIADVVQIGYDDSVDDGEQEKQGNFCPYIYDLGKKTDVTEDPDIDAVERCVRWNSENMKSQKKILSAIATNSVKNLIELLDIHLGSPEAVFPLFTTIHEQLVLYMKTKQAESGDSEVMINFAGNFDVYCRLVDGGETVIEYSPKPSLKLGIKNDSAATAPTEEQVNVLVCEKHTRIFFYRKIKMEECV